MKVYVNGQAVDLQQSDYVGAGGEGTIYVKGATAYKVYHDPKDALPKGKLAELSSITDTNVIRPLEMLSDKSGKPLGYTMRFLKNCVALCQLFPRAFRDRNSVSHKHVQDLVLKLRSMVQNIHSASVLVVDLNELNFMVDKHFKEIYGIDADSYQTRSYPAKVIMPSIRDWSVQPKGFSELSDWYSFGIVTFNMFTGIHPYKGKHPKVTGLEERMKAGASVFDSGVKLPAVVYPFDVIPDIYKEWYKAVFKDGKRLPPPMDYASFVAVSIPASVLPVRGTTTLEIKCLHTYKQIAKMWTGPHRVVYAGGSLYKDDLLLGFVDSPEACGFTPSNRLVTARVDNGKLELMDMEARAPIRTLDIEADSVASYDGRIYVKSYDSVYEIVLVDASPAIASLRKAVNVLPHASTLYQGVVMQNLLGAVHAHLLYDKGKCVALRIKEIDGYRVLDAKYDGNTEHGVLMVVAEKRNKIYRFIVRMSLSSWEYHVRRIDDTDNTPPNFIVTDSGVCASITEEEKLELFSANPTSTAMKIVDSGVNAAMILHKEGRVVFHSGDSVYSLKTL